MNGNLVNIGALQVVMVSPMSRPTCLSYSLSTDSSTRPAMSPDFLEVLSSRIVFPDSKGKGLPILRVSTPLFTACIALQGAQLLSFQATNGKPLLWLSPNCDFTPGVALRGGIPICLPWFGPHAQDSTKPKHGFARNRDWTLTSAQASPDGQVQLVFNFESPANELFDFDFCAQLTMNLGATLKLDLALTNTDTRPFTCSWALHSYHPVSQLEKVRILGLAGRTYLDNLENHAPKTQQGDVIFTSEVDRVFPAIENVLEVSGSPTIQIAHHNCPSVVVWNPGPMNAAKIVDIGAGHEQKYVCVERGAVLSEGWELAAGETKSAWVEIKEVK